jgi:hypothetical protein
MNSVSKYQNLCFSICNACVYATAVEKQLYDVNEVLLGGNTTSTTILVSNSVAIKVNQIFNNPLIKFASFQLSWKIFEERTNGRSFVSDLKNFYVKHYLVIERTIQASTCVFNLYTGNYIHVITTVAVFALETLDNHQLLPLSISSIKNHTYEFLNIGYDIGLIFKTNNMLYKALFVILATDNILKKLNISSNTLLSFVVKPLDYLWKLESRYNKSMIVKMFGKKYRVCRKHLFDGHEGIMKASITRKVTLAFMGNLVQQYKTTQNEDNQAYLGWGNMKKEDFIAATFDDEDYKAAPLSETPGDKAILDLKKNIITQMEGKLRDFRLNKYGWCPKKEADRISNLIAESVYVMKNKLEKMTDKTKKDAYVLEFFKKFTYCDSGLKVRLSNFLKVENHNIEYDLGAKIHEGLQDFRDILFTNLAGEITQKDSPISWGSPRIYNRMLKTYKEHFPGDYEVDTIISSIASGYFSLSTSHLPQLQLKVLMISGLLGLFSFTSINDEKRPTIKVNGKDVPLTLYHFGQDQSEKITLNGSKETLDIDSMTDLHDEFFSRRRRKPLSKLRKTYPKLFNDETTLSTIRFDPWEQYSPCILVDYIYNRQIDALGINISTQDILRELKTNKKLRNHLFSDTDKIMADEHDNITYDEIVINYTDLTDEGYERRTPLKRKFIARLLEYYNIIECVD